MNTKITISKIAEFLNESFYGSNFSINKPTSLEEIEDNTLVFSKSKTLTTDLSYKSLILCPLDFEYIDNSVYTVIKVKNPRLIFAKVVNEFFINNNNKGIDQSSSIGIECKIEKHVGIGKNTIIGNNVTIGKNTIIKHNVVIFDNTTIGENCYIKSGSIIGEDGFGFDFEEDKTPIRIPHIGNVEIGDNVEIGANTVISRGTLGSTTIGNDVKIDDQVFIAHNCKIGQKTLIIAFAEISGSVVIGENCWIGPNSSIIQKVNIGDGVTIGIGAIVVNSVESNKKVMGLDALDLRKLLKLKKRIEFGK